MGVSDQLTESQVVSSLVEQNRNWHLEHNWVQLEGTVVELRSAGGDVVDQGRVESVAKDGSVLWLAFEGAARRRLHEKLPGIEAWIRGSR